MMTGRKVKVFAVVPAAGIGKRFGPGGKKLFNTLGGKPVVIHTLELLQSAPEITEIIPAVKEEDLMIFADLIEEFELNKVKQIVPGGQERQDSVYNGLRFISDDASVVLIHDGGRPFADCGMISRVLDDIEGCDGTVAAVPVKDTIKEAAAGDEEADALFVRCTLNRSVLYAVQTPQAFPFGVIMEAHEKAKRERFLGTDDASLVERYGGKIRLVPGSYRNIKITTPEDLAVAEALLALSHRPECG